MAAEIAVAGIPTVGAVALTVAEVEADLAAEIEEDSEVVASISQAFQHDVTSVETPARFPLNQTEASRYCAVTVSEEMKAAATHEASIAPRRLVDSQIDLTTAHDVSHQGQLR